MDYGQLAVNFPFLRPLFPCIDMESLLFHNKCDGSFEKKVESWQ